MYREGDGCTQMMMQLCDASSTSNFHKVVIGPLSTHNTALITNYQRGLACEVPLFEMAVDARSCTPCYAREPMLFAFML